MQEVLGLGRPQSATGSCSRLPTAAVPYPCATSSAAPQGHGPAGGPNGSPEILPEAGEEGCELLTLLGLLSHHVGLGLDEEAWWLLVPSDPSAGLTSGHVTLIRSVRFKRRQGVSGGGRGDRAPLPA